MTSCYFGGKDFDTLYITSAWAGSTTEQRLTEPMAGGLFEVKPLVRGLPTYSYEG